MRNLVKNSPVFDWHRPTESNYHYRQDRKRELQTLLAGIERPNGSLNWPEIGLVAELSRRFSVSKSQQIMHQQATTSRTCSRKPNLLSWLAKWQRHKQLSVLKRSSAPPTCSITAHDELAPAGWWPRPHINVYANETTARLTLLLCRLPLSRSFNLSANNNRALLSTKFRLRWWTLEKLALKLVIAFEMVGDIGTTINENRLINQQILIKRWDIWFVRFNH